MPPDGPPDFKYVSKLSIAARVNIFNACILLNLRGPSGFFFFCVSRMFNFGLSGPETAVFPCLAMLTSFLLSLLALFLCLHELNIQSEIHFILHWIFRVKVYHLVFNHMWKKSVNKYTCLYVYCMSFVPQAQFWLFPLNYLKTCPHIYMHIVL